MEDKNIRPLYEWLDPHINKKELNDTIRRLETASKPRDIAYKVIANLQGVGKVNSATALSEDFIKALLSLAPNLKQGANVPAVSYHVRKMIDDLEWHRKEREKDKARKEQKLNQYIIVVKKDKVGQMESILNFLDKMEVVYETINLTNILTNGVTGSFFSPIGILAPISIFSPISFLGMIYKTFAQSDSNGTLVQIEGSAGELHDVLTMIESAFGDDALDDISLTSAQGETDNDALTIPQAISLLENM